MDLYASKSSAVPQKLAITAIEIALIGMAGWLLTGPGGAMAASVFGFELPASTPARYWVILAFSAVTLVRFVFMMFVLMRRTIATEELISVPLAFAVYYVGFALLVLPNATPLDLWDASGVAVFALGAFVNTYGEWQRKRFKDNPAHKGKLFTGGLFSLSMHVNFLGDVLWVTGYAIVARQLWGALIPVSLLAFFVFWNVPALDRHLAAHYGEAFTDYAARTRRLIPFVW
jgi:protein-S-isoprenylcysteine O-methyltransferase Ste14